MLDGLVKVLSFVIIFICLMRHISGNFLKKTSFKMNLLKAFSDTKAFLAPPLLKMLILVVIHQSERLSFISAYLTIFGFL